MNIRYWSTMAASLLLAVTLTACEKDSPMEQMAEDVDDMVEDAADEVEDAADRLEEQIEDAR